MDETPSPRLRGEGRGEGDYRHRWCRGESPSPGLLRNPTSPRKRGEVQREGFRSMAPALQTRYVFSLAIKVGAPIVAGDTGHGVRRIIPILGGEVRGEGIKGTIFPVGA